MSHHPKKKREEAAILNDIRAMYNQLSPENLNCDGEISRAAAARKEARLRHQLNGYFVELGRKLSETEVYQIDPVLYDIQVES